MEGNRRMKGSGELKGLGKAAVRMLKLRHANMIYETEIKNKGKSDKDA